MILKLNAANIAMWSEIVAVNVPFSAMVRGVGELQHTRSVSVAFLLDILVGRAITEHRRILRMFYLN